MRYGFIAALAAFAVALAPAVKADDAPKDVKGLFLTSDYPAAGRNIIDRVASAKF
jgi:hypothetical protein